MLSARTMHPSRLLTSVAAIALVSAGLACGSDGTGPGDRVPAALNVAGGDEQQGVVGTMLPDPLVVVVVDEDGHPISGQLINFRVVAGGGTVFAGSALSDAAGIARERWTLGTTAGQQRVEARVVDRTGAAIVVATFSATALADAPQSIERTAGHGQSGAAGSVLPDSVEVRVLDRYGNPVPDVTISWSPSSGSVSPATSTTRTSGIARAQWTLGPEAGRQTLDAGVGAISTTFDATAGPAAPAALAVVAGNGQAGTVATALPESLVVQLSDAFGNPVSGAAVAWTTVAPGGTLSPATVTTDQQGFARARWTLGTQAGAQEAQAASGNVTATLGATASPGAPTRIELVRGGGQEGVVTTALPESLVVRVTDAHGNAIPGTSVGWTVATSDAGAISPASATTDGAGLAGGRWTLGTRAGMVTAIATAGSATRQIAARALAGPVAGVMVIAGQGQQGTVAQPLTDSLAVRVVDAYGNPVEGAAVTFSAVDGSASPDTRMSSATGEARTRWTLGTVAGTQRLSAATTAGAAVEFTATAQPGPPSRLRIASGDAQTGLSGRPLPDSLVARVEDAFGNPVPGARVTWTVLAGGGAPSPPASNADGAGLATTQWTLGASGSNTMRASLDQLSVTFQAMATASGSPALLKVAGDGQSERVGGYPGGATLSPLVVRLLDAAGQPVQGATVNWTRSPTTGTVASGSITAQSTSDGAGEARATWALSSTAGTHTAVAVWGDLTATFTAEGRAGSLCSSALSGPSHQTGREGVELPIPYHATGADYAGNPVPPEISISTYGGGSQRWVYAPDGLSFDSYWTLGPAGTEQRLFVQYSICVIGIRRSQRGEFTATSTP